MYPYQAHRLYTFPLRTKGYLLAAGVTIRTQEFLCKPHFGGRKEGKAVRRTVVFLIVLSMALFGSNASALAQNPPSNASSTTFSDVPADHWAYEEILALHQRGVITGHGDGTFEPDAVVLRSEFAKMMVLALDLSLADTASPTFLDVPKGDWACKYVEAARIYLTGFRTSHGDYQA